MAELIRGLPLQPRVCILGGLPQASSTWVALVFSCWAHRSRKDKVRAQASLLSRMDMPAESLLPSFKLSESPYVKQAGSFSVKKEKWTHF